MDDPVSALPVLAGFHYPLSTSWSVILISLLLSAFCSGIEIAFISANKLRIELQNKKGGIKARILSRYMKNPADFISTTLVANNVALVVYGIFMGDVLDSLLSDILPGNFIRFVTLTLLSTVIVLITAEFLPKSLFRINPEFALNAFIVPFRLIHLALFPLVAAVKWSSRLLLRMFTGQHFPATEPVFTKVDLDEYISQSEEPHVQTQSAVDTEILRNAMEFSSTRVRDCMVPRTEIISLDERQGIAGLRKTFIDSAHSKIPIYRDHIDNIIGYVHLAEMFEEPENISKVILPVLVTSDAVKAQELLRLFIQQRRSMAVVVDEFGGTAGIVTIEDLLEEIFGEIDDEYDTDSLKEVVFSDSHYQFSARLEVDYLNNKYNLDIPEGDYNTLGGFIISAAEKIPKTRETVNTGHYSFTILKAKGARIEEVELKLRGEE